MTQEDTGEQKNFEPTPKRLEDARKKGEVARSNDVHTAAAYAGFLIVVWQLAPDQLGRFGAIGAHLIENAENLSDHFLFGQFSGAWGGFMGAVALAFSAFFVVPAALVLVSLVAQGAIVWAPDRIAPKSSRISPISNAMQKFGAAGLMEFAKSFVKMLAFGIAFVIFVVWNLDHMVMLVWLSPAQVIVALGQFVVRFMVIVVAMSAILGAIDYMWQRFDHLRKHRMSRQEIMDETKQSEGDPHLKSKRRQRAEAIATNRMLRDVAQAAVVIVNPAHYAVALKWAPHDATPPVCVAKGIDETARQIRMAAMEHGVPIRRDPPVARTIYATVRVSHPIERDQFEAVAAAIRFAEDMRRKARERPWAR